MGEHTNYTKEALNRAIGALKENLETTFPEEELESLVVKIQSTRNALVQNEKKIWLRTKNGRKMLGKFSMATQTLIEVIDAGSDPDGIRDAVSEVERQAKILSEEIRKRSMVVT